jgi:hypothetical protein
MVAAAIHHQLQEVWNLDVMGILSDAQSEDITDISEDSV